MIVNEGFYLFIITAELLFLISASVYIIFLIYSWLKGAPYVATQKKSLDSIIQHARIKDGQRIVELGSGDGRFLLEVAKKYKIIGLGVDINPIPILKARIFARMQKVSSVTFLLKDIRETDLTSADVIYIFLFPKLVQAIQDNLLKNTKRNALIISHGFKIEYLSKYHINTIKNGKFNTYFYKMK
ncbi:MAG: hypothetical protein US54_C0049G0011 [Candidatus Roizmanbacteria bacterium GW2011_GWA2_37_7]|uniref:Methyltransferase domain-containing protein n=1 Tax=Candidatus Roizmanbacteria bacterium GW2011_GWA2_37_7 TaxID=1618481 RepID=A0A0G0H115_9BACT|nr:MAG: hypothetical protein US54_C0049G0011 [Candidatus Roizmanbacteria bacterium GW2011_GWA2_37_7]